MVQVGWKCTLRKMKLFISRYCYVRHWGRNYSQNCWPQFRIYCVVIFNVDWLLLKNIYCQLPRSIGEIYFPDFSLRHVTCFAYGILADMIQRLKMCLYRWAFLLCLYISETWEELVPRMNEHIWRRPEPSLQQGTGPGQTHSLNQNHSAKPSLD